MFSWPHTAALLAALIGLSACQTAPQVPPALPSLNALPGTQWVLADVAVAQLPLSQQPELQFISLTQVTGNGGCNRFAGAARIAGTALQLGPLAGTRRACAGGLMELEGRVMRALESTREGRLEPGQLVLLDARGGELLRLVQRR